MLTILGSIVPIDSDHLPGHWFTHLLFSKKHLFQLHYHQNVMYRYESLNIRPSTDFFEHSYFSLLYILSKRNSLLLAVSSDVDPLTCQQPHLSVVHHY